MTRPTPLRAVPPAPPEADPARELYSEDFERLILGCRVRHGRRADLTADSFRNPANGNLWSLMDSIDAQLRAAGSDATADYHMVVERVARHPKADRVFGGLGRVAHALDVDANPSALPYYASRVRDLARANGAFHACTTAVEALPHLAEPGEVEAALVELLASVARAAGRDTTVAAFRRAFAPPEGS